MKRTDRKNWINNMMQFVLFLSAMVIVSNIVSCDRPQDKSWYIHAKEYIDADINIRKVTKNETSFGSYYDLRHKAETKLISTVPPTIQELQELLKSKNISQQEIALVTIRVRKINEESLFRIIIENYLHPTNDDYIKYYSLQCLKLLQNDQLVNFEDPILRMFSIEKDESMIINGLPLLIKLNTSKVKPLFVEYLVSGGVGLRRTAYILMNTENKVLCDSVIKQLREDNKTEALKFIKKLEESRYTTKDPLK